MEDSPINDLPDDSAPRLPGNVIVATGAVIAVLLGIPSFFIGLFGVGGVLSGEKIVAGTLGALWGYMASVGAYELNRRKFDWQRGRRYRDRHLLAGTLAVSIGLILSGALHETMPTLAIVPALSAIKQANDGHASKYPALLHTAVLAVGLTIGIWFYVDGVTGKIWVERLASLP